MRASSSKGKTIEDKYQKLSQREHVLQLPDTYCGSVEPSTETRFVYDDTNNAMTVKEVTYTPALYKIFDEVLVNARDHKVRDPNVRNIKIDVNANTGEISVYNDGGGIEVEKHQEHDMYVPQLIFGELLTSANYDQEEKRTVGG